MGKHGLDFDTNHWSVDADSGIRIGCDLYELIKHNKEGRTE